MFSNSQEVKVRTGFESGLGLGLSYFLVVELIYFLWSSTKVSLQTLQPEPQHVEEIRVAKLLIGLTNIFEKCHSKDLATLGTSNG